MEVTNPMHVKWNIFTVGQKLGHSAQAEHHRAKLTGVPCAVTVPTLNVEQRNRPTDVGDFTLPPAKSGTFIQ